MLSAYFPTSIRMLYIISVLLALIVLVLALLDLGFGSLFLGIIGPLALFVHHGCTLLYLRGSDTSTDALMTSIPHIISIGFLALVWLAGSVLVGVWGGLYTRGKAQMIVQAAGTPATVVAQGAVGLLEALALGTMFGTLVHIRNRRLHEALYENKVDASIVSTPIPHRPAPKP